MRRSKIETTAEHIMRELRGWDAQQMKEDARENASDHENDLKWVEAQLRRLLRRFGVSSSKIRLEKYQ